MGGMPRRTVIFFMRTANLFFLLEPVTKPAKTRNTPFCMGNQGFGIEITLSHFFFKNPNKYKNLREQ